MVDDKYLKVRVPIKGKNKCHLQQRQRLLCFGNK